MPDNNITTIFKVNRLKKQFATQQLPTLEKEINAVIARRETSLPIIESLLKLASMLTEVGVGNGAYEKLCQYYVALKQKSRH